MGVSVLIVDDQAPFRLAARAVVEATDGFDVVGEVETGEAALDAARELRPDLVLMDVNLPGISGLDATRVLLAGGDEPRPLVIVFSTYEPAEYAPRAAEAGAVGYITKSELSPDPLEEVWAAAQNGRPASA